jgi:hypothetical protein
VRTRAARARASPESRVAARTTLQSSAEIRERLNHWRHVPASASTGRARANASPVQRSARAARKPWRRPAIARVTGVRRAPAPTCATPLPTHAAANARPALRIAAPATSCSTAMRQAIGRLRPRAPAFRVVAVSAARA